MDSYSFAPSVALFVYPALNHNPYCRWNATARLVYQDSRLELMFPQFHPTCGSVLIPAHERLSTALVHSSLEQVLMQYIDYQNAGSTSSINRRVCRSTSLSSPGIGNNTNFEQPA